MPKPLIVPTTIEPSWMDLRTALQRCIKLAAPAAKVYARWPLKFDLARTAELLKSSEDNGRIHSWIMGVSKATSYTDRNGPHILIWDLTIKIWGFIGYEYGIDDDNTQNVLEDECRKIGQVLAYNREHLSLDNTSGLKEVGWIRFEEIDTEGFGQDDIIVARGELDIKMYEYLQAS